MRNNNICISIHDIIEQTYPSAVTPLQLATVGVTTFIGRFRVLCRCCRRRHRRRRRRLFRRIVVVIGFTAARFRRRRSFVSRLLARASRRRRARVVVAFGDRADVVDRFDVLASHDGRVRCAAVVVRCAVVVVVVVATRRARELRRRRSAACGAAQRRCASRLRIATQFQCRRELRRLCAAVVEQIEFQKMRFKLLRRVCLCKIRQIDLHFANHAVLLLAFVLFVTHKTNKVVG
jgi:hypothetical protein